MSRISVLFLLLVWVSTSCQESKPKATSEPETESPEPEAQKLTTELTEIHKMGQINGFGAAVVSSDAISYAEGIGFSNVEKQEAYTANTLQNIGSVSKTFIGIALLKAQELGHLQLDDPVNQHLPFEVRNPAFPKTEITLRQLAIHTSSILDTEWYNNKCYVLKDEADEPLRIAELDEVFNPAQARMTVIEYLEKVLSSEGEWYSAAEGFTPYEPGVLSEYSNVGATLAAAVLEQATGTPFNEFVAEHILKPLNMNASGWSFDEVDLAHHSTLYANPTTPLPLYSLVTYPDGGLITSISDLAKYLQELIRGQAGQGKLLTKASYDELFRKYLVSEPIPDGEEQDDYNDEYNSGIFMGFTPAGYIGHTGGDPGIATYLFFDPATQTGKILMINTSVRNSVGVDEFYAIWNKLADYQEAWK